MTRSARARLGIDQSNTGAFEACEVRDDVVGAVRDVVQALTPSLEEAAYGSFRAQGFEEFDMAYEGHPNSLGLEDLDGGTGLPRQEFIQDCTLLERVDGDRHVIERATDRIDRIHQRPVPEGAVRVNGTWPSFAGTARERYKESRNGKRRDH